MTDTTVRTSTGGVLSIEEVLSYRQRGLSLAAIAMLDGTTKQAISQRMKRSGLDPGEIARFRKDRGMILSAKQKILIDQITPDAVKKMSPRDRVISFAVLFDKERLETGLSTGNVANLHAIAERAIKLVSTREHGADAEQSPTQLPVSSGPDGGAHAAMGREFLAVRGDPVIVVNASHHPDGCSDPVPPDKRRRRAN